MRFLFVLPFSLILGGCVSQFLSENEKNQNHLLYEEMRQELADVKHSLQSTQLSLQILEEKIQDQEHSFTSFKQQEFTKTPRLEQLGFQVNALEKKFSLLEKAHEKSTTDFKHLQFEAGQTAQKIQDLEREIAQHKLHLSDIAKLKTTLTSISEAMHPPQPVPLKKHKVKSGETLEKIARQYHTTVSAIKKQNQIRDDRIRIGDEIEIPNE
jgi:LysM repeat protein